MHVTRPCKALRWTRNKLLAHAGGVIGLSKLVMGIIEAIMIGIQIDRLQKPIMFVSMLVCFLAFLVFGVVVVLAGFEVMLSGKGVLSAMGAASFSVVFFGLAAVCGHFIKKCVQ